MQPQIPRLVPVLLAVALLGGCNATPRAQPAKGKSAGSDQVSMADPCANQLHDMCGALLLHYYTYHQLPQQLDELRKMQSFGQELQLSCPESNLPYVYNRTGILDMEKNARIIIYDPQPTHVGTRRAISIIEPRGNEALVAKVVALPESFFLLQNQPK